MTLFEKVEKFVKDVFKTTVEIFIEALRLSKSARGYIHGSITELLLKKELEEKYDCEVYRIREKWEGKNIIIMGISSLERIRPALGLF
jgi:hypothetical protein